MGTTPSSAMTSKRQVRLTIHSIKVTARGTTASTMRWKRVNLGVRSAVTQLILSCGPRMGWMEGFGALYFEDKCSKLAPASRAWRVSELAGGRSRVVVSHPCDKSFARMGQPVDAAQE